MQIILNDDGFTIEHERHGWILSQSEGGRYYRKFDESGALLESHEYRIVRTPNKTMFMHSNGFYKEEVCDDDGRLLAEFNKWPDGGHVLAKTYKFRYYLDSCGDVRAERVGSANHSDYWKWKQNIQTEFVVEERRVEPAPVMSAGNWYNLWGDAYHDSYVPNTASPPVLSRAVLDDVCAALRDRAGQPVYSEDVLDVPAYIHVDDYTSQQLRCMP